MAVNIFREPVLMNHVCQCQNCLVLFETADILSHGHVLYSGQMSITYV